LQEYKRNNKTKRNKTRNSFCGTWYLPHSQFHNERTVPIIMTGCIAHARNGHISTFGLKSDVTVVLLDPAFLKDAKISAIRPLIRVILRIFYCACAKRPYFHFRSKIWRDHRVPRPRFPLRRENSGDSRTFKADIGLLNICMGFQDLLVYWGFGGKWKYRTLHYMQSHGKKCCYCSKMP